MGYSREVYDAALAALEKRRIDAVNRAAALKDRMAAKYPRVREIEAMMAGCSVQVAKAVLDGRRCGGGGGADQKRKSGPAGRSWPLCWPPKGKTPGISSPGIPARGAGTRDMRGGRSAPA